MQKQKTENPPTVRLQSCKALLSFLQATHHTQGNKRKFVKIIRRGGGGVFLSRMHKFTCALEHQHANQPECQPLLDTAEEVVQVVKYIKEIRSSTVQCLGIVLVIVEDALDGAGCVVWCQGLETDVLQTHCAIAIGRLKGLHLQLQVQHLAQPNTNT